MVQTDHPLVFPWETLDAIIGGKSAIDVPRLQVYHLREAEAFLEGYGFRWDDRFHCSELEEHRKEAIHFLESELLIDEPDLSIPKVIREQKDVRRLLLWASESEKGSIQQAWSCAIVRLMHTFTHCESYFNERFGSQIREQILQRFQPHLHEEEGRLMLKDNTDSIPLADFSVKHSKPKYSLALKLLHKAENVAADVFDRIGVRFVTLDRFDALRVVRYLRTRNVFMFANVKPSRSRNTLIQLEWLKGEIAALLSEEDSSEYAHHLDALRDKIEHAPYTGPPASSHNPHSSRKYHSIQFTCRQMIRVENPYTPVLAKRLESTYLARPELRTLCNELQSSLRDTSQIRFFFPFEVQIMDEKSFEMSRVGEAAHADYKRRQRESVKRRILGPLFSLQADSAA